VALRLALLDAHYHADRDWIPEALDTARRRLARWREAVTLPAGPDATGTLERVRDRLADDLDTPAALVAIDRWADEALTRRGAEPDSPALIRDLADALLGLAL
jgi:L-cysteine:1D-myo-inositol 2-amino-2-deoxy-alpha-D-glucopyranoside ligase